MIFNSMCDHLQPFYKNYHAGGSAGKKMTEDASKQDVSYTKS